MSNIFNIYVSLLEEGTPTRRSTTTERISEDLYRVLTNDNYDPEDEMWEFPPGSIVRLEQRTFENEVYLKAVKP